MRNYNIKVWLKNNLYKSTIYAIIGKRGSGKSCLGFSLLEKHNKIGRQCYAYKYPKPELLPQWITNINSLAEAKESGTILLDEAGIEFNQFSFNSQQSIELAKILKVARHKDLSIIFVTQNGATLTKDINRLIDSFLLKEPSLTQKYFDSSMIKAIYQNCGMLFSGSPDEYYILELGEMARFKRPQWFTDEISKSYNGDTQIPDTDEIAEEIITENPQNNQKIVKKDPRIATITKDDKEQKINIPKESKR